MHFKPVTDFAQRQQSKRGRREKMNRVYVRQVELALLLALPLDLLNFRFAGLLGLEINKLFCIPELAGHIQAGGWHDEVHAHGCELLVDAVHDMVKQVDDGWLLGMLQLYECRPQLHDDVPPVVDQYRLIFLTEQNVQRTLHIRI